MIWFYILSSSIIQKNYNCDSPNSPPNCAFTQQSSENENTYDIFMNEVRMEDEPFLEPQENINSQENESLQIKKSGNLKTNEDKTKNNFKTFHVQRWSWKRNNRNALCWAFYCVNDNKEVTITTPQTMCYIFLSY